MHMSPHMYVQAILVTFQVINYLQYTSKCAYRYQAKRATHHPDIGPAVTCTDCPAEGCAPSTRSCSSMQQYEAPTTALHSWLCL